MKFGFRDLWNRQSFHDSDCVVGAGYPPADCYHLDALRARGNLGESLLTLAVTDGSARRPLACFRGLTGHGPSHAYSDSLMLIDVP